MKRFVGFIAIIQITWGFIFPAFAANIIWVSDAHEAVSPGIKDDIGWSLFLQEHGHIVDYREGMSPGIGYWRTLDSQKISALNEADMVIVSRDTFSGEYCDGTETSDWASIKSPLILLNLHLSRSSRWRWLKTTSLNDQVSSPTAIKILKPNHPYFTDIVYNDPENHIVEYACRALREQEYGFQTKYELGDNQTVNFNDYMFCAGNKFQYDTEGYHHLKPNGFRLYNTHGSVWEWCADKYDSDRFTKPITDPQTPYTKGWSGYVVRGGAYDSPRSECKASSRKEQKDAAPNTGFRIILK